MTALQRIIACSIAGILWLAAIVAKHFWADIDIGAFCAACASVITAIGIHGAATGSPLPAPNVRITAAQAGFARPLLLAIVAFVAGMAMLLTGCTTTTGAMYTGIAAQAEAGIKVFDDNTLATVKSVLRAQPYSAIQRHPELQPGILALCGPLTNTASLDPAQVMQMLSIAKQLGITAVAAPAAAASVAK